MRFLSLIFVVAVLYMGYKKWIKDIPALSTAELHGVPVVAPSPTPKRFTPLPTPFQGKPLPPLPESSKRSSQGRAVERANQVVDQVKRERAGQER